MRCACDALALRCVAFALRERFARQPVSELCVDLRLSTPRSLARPPVPLTLSRCQAVEMDEDVMMAYLEGEEPDVATLKRLIRKGTIAGAFVPGAFAAFLILFILLYSFCFILLYFFPHRTCMRAAWLRAAQHECQTRVRRVEASSRATLPQRRRLSSLAPVSPPPPYLSVLFFFE